MIFVIVGSQKFQFNRLLKKIDELIDNNIIKDEVFAQVGASDYEPVNYKFKNYLNQVEFKKLLSNSNLVITHGGTGAIVGALRENCKVLAIPRLAKFGEHVDNHQRQILSEFESMGYIEVCEDLASLEGSYNRILNKDYREYKSNTENIMKNINEFLKNQ